MGVTPNLNILQMLATDTGKSNEINAALIQFDGAMCSVKNETISGSSYNLSLYDFQNFAVFKFNGALSGNCTVVLPLRARFFVIINATTGGHDLIFSMNGATVTISDASAHAMYSDGNANLLKCS